MRAGQAALSTLDAQLRVPHRDDVRDVALLERRRARRIRAIHRHLADAEVVAAAEHHARRHLTHELGRIGSHDRRSVERAGCRKRHTHLEQIRQRRVHRSEILADHVVALRLVAGDDRLLDARDRLLARQHAGDREEARLQHGVDPSAQAGVARDLGGVDHVKAELPVQDLLLHRARQPVPYRFGSMRRVEQEGPTLDGEAQHVDPVQDGRLMTGDELGRLQQIRRADRSRPEAQVRDGLRARLVRVVDEVALRVHPGLGGDDLHAVLVGAYGAIRAEAEEQRADLVVPLERERRIDDQAAVRDIVVDPDGERLLG